MDTTSSRNLYFSYLPEWYTTADLRALCEPYGAVESVKVMVDTITRRCKGSGFVLFETEAEATGAIKQLFGMEVGGKTIQVKRARKTTRGPNATKTEGAESDVSQPNSAATSRKTSTTSIGSLPAYSFPSPMAAQTSSQAPAQQQQPLVMVAPPLQLPMHVQTQPAPMWISPQSQPQPVTQVQSQSPSQRQSFVQQQQRYPQFVPQAPPAAADLASPQPTQVPPHYIMVPQPMMTSTTPAPPTVLQPTASFVPPPPAAATSIIPSQPTPLPPAYDGKQLPPHQVVYHYPAGQ